MLSACEIVFQPSQVY